jgi:23S rRNA (pseudouridine1915-N3)-methyltransferase
VRVTILAVGRMRAGPERMLVDDYLRRFERTGHAVGLGPASVVEVGGRGGGRAAEARAIAAAVPHGAKLFILDERGDCLSSSAFARRLVAAAEGGARDLSCAIGGAEGFDPVLRERADLAIAFGRMVWPHLLARVMLAEQLYRAASILAGTPYHRGG